MVRTTTTTEKPSLLSRLRHRRDAKVTTTSSTNPITGTHTTTKKTKTHPQGIGHHGHGGRGPLASNHRTTHTTSSTMGSTTRTTGTTTGTHHQRKAGVGDKVSGAMTKLKGDLTGKPGVKAAGTRRMHGTDGKGSHRVY